MAPTPYIAGVVNRSLPRLHGQYVSAVKRKDFMSDRLSASTALRPAWTWRLLPAQQMRFASNKDKKSDKDKEANKDKEWYDWYARLHADPKASAKDLKKAFYKRAKVEHPDQDKTPGAKARFQNLQDTFNNLCDESKRKTHDQERLARKREAADAADSLQAKWKANEEALRKAEDTRTRETRKTTQEGHKPAKPSKANGPGGGSQQPKGSDSKTTKEAPRKEQQQQPKAEETEEDRVRKQKIADDLLAKKNAASEEKKKKKRRENEATVNTTQNSHPQMRVIVIRGLPKETGLMDLFEPLINLTPGPVFRAEFRSQITAEIEFCTATAARRVFDLAREKRLFIKGERMVHVNLIMSANKLPVIGSKSRVLSLRGGVLGTGIFVMGGDLEDFLKNKTHSLQVERAVLSIPSWDFKVRFASWAEAERAKVLLARHLTGLSATYGPDPCETGSGQLYRSAGAVLEAWGSANTELEREDLVEIAVLIALIVALVVWYFKERTPREQEPSPAFDYQKQEAHNVREGSREQSKHDGQG